MANKSKPTKKGEKSEREKRERNETPRSHEEANNKTAKKGSSVDSDTNLNFAIDDEVNHANSSSSSSNKNTRSDLNANDSRNNYLAAGVDASIANHPNATIYDRLSNQPDPRTDSHGFSEIISPTQNSRVRGEINDDHNYNYDYNDSNARRNNNYPMGQNNRSTSRSNVSMFEAVDAATPIQASYRKITVEDLMREDPPRRRTVFYGQILRVVSGYSLNNTTVPTYTVSYYNKKLKSKTDNASYARLMLLRDMSSNTGQTVYIMESRSSNNSLWRKNPILRDNGVVTIGTCIAILNPLPIEHQLSGDVPMMQTDFGCIVLKKPSALREIRIITNIENRNTRAFVLNNAQIEIRYTAGMETKCSGLFCDRQRSAELLESNRTCGCYQMHSRQSNIVLKHDMNIKHISLSETLKVKNFSSLCFSSLYLDQPFPTTMRVGLLDGTPLLESLEDVIDEVVDTINTNNGFTIVGWYKRGESQDTSSADIESKVVSGEAGFHIVQIRPTDYCIRANQKFQVAQFIESSST